MLEGERMKSKILVVDDETDAVDLIEFNLKGAGYDVVAANDGAEALRKARSVLPALIILDLMLPEIDGMEVCKQLKRDPATAKIPIIMLTAKAAEIDRVLGLELGADDYISKPYSSRELVARIRAILRRAAFIDTGSKNQQLAFGPIAVDLDMHIVRISGEAMDLTRREFELLAYFLQNPRRVLSREKILQQVWGLEYLGESRTIDAHVRRVRSKLGDSASLIETVVGVGYRLGSVDA
jgi:DNA-binding response OmpR family regulator